MRGLACLVVLCGATVAAASPKMLKGPYLQDLAPSSITIMWEMDEPQPAKLVVTGPAKSDTMDGSDALGVRIVDKEQNVPADHIAEARVDGLEPSSRYRYRVEAGGQTWEGEFATAPPAGKDVPFSFIVVGDSRYGDFTDQHRRVTERMEQEVPDFVIGTGDMVDEGFRLDQWQRFFDVENKFLRDNVYFPTLGNHDRQGQGRTADSYRAFFSVPDNGADSERYYAFTYGAARFLVLDSNAYSFALTDQTAWLERELVAARQDPAIHHIFVTMHHPAYSISLHGGARDLRERWAPLFEKYQVTAVFAGHDHVYERAEAGGIRYFVTGGGGAPLYPRRPKPNPIDAEAVKKFERVLHFLRVTVTGRTIEVTAVRVDGTLIEATTWQDGPEPPQPLVPKQVAEIRSPGAAPPPAPPAVAERTRPVGSPWWIAAGAGLMFLAAGFVLVHTLRR